MSIPYETKRKHGYWYDQPNQSPILFEIYQDDMEKIMFFLDKYAKIDPMIQKIKDGFQRNIDCHILRGEWFVDGKKLFIPEEEQTEGIVLR